MINIRTEIQVSEIQHILLGNTDIKDEFVEKMVVILQN